MTRREDFDGILSSIDGALADVEIPGAMRWSPEPETVDAPAPFDGELVWQPPERYEDVRLDRGVVRSSGVRLTRLDELGRPIGAPHPIPGGYVSITVLDGRGWSDPSSDPLGDLRRVSDRLRARDRVIARSQRRGPTADLALFDEVFLIDPAHREEVRAHRQEEAQRIFRALGDWFTDLAEAVSSVVNEIGKVFTGLARPAPPPRPLRETDPRAYALQLRQARGTGPDRQVQHRHRPRRH